MGSTKYTLNDAVRTAVESEAFEKAERFRPDYARVADMVEETPVHDDMADGLKQYRRCLLS